MLLGLLSALTPTLDELADNSPGEVRVLYVLSLFWLLLALLGGWHALACYRYRLTWDDQVIDIQNLIFRQRFRIDDVRELVWSSSSDTATLEGPFGTVRIDFWLFPPSEGRELKRLLFETIPYERQWVGYAKSESCTERHDATPPGRTDPVTPSGSTSPPMYHRSVRPLSDSERSDLENRAQFQRPPKEPLTRWQRFREFIGVGNETSFRDYWLDLGERLVPIWKDILADGHVVVHRIQSKAVVELQQSEDEGNSYFFDVGDGRVFCYCCYQGADEPPLSESWPNDDIEVMQARVHPGYFNHLTMHGSRIEPGRTIYRPFALWDYLPEPGENLIEGTLETIESDLVKRSRAEKS